MLIRGAFYWNRINLWSVFVHLKKPTYVTFFDTAKVNSCLKNIEWVCYEKNLLVCCVIYFLLLFLHFDCYFIPIFGKKEKKIVSVAIWIFPVTLHTHMSVVLESKLSIIEAQFEVRGRIISYLFNSCRITLIYF
jgi:hypothetical protein